MRTSAAVLSALLSTGVIAHPFHMAHHKRDGAELVNTYVKDGVQYQEYVETVVVHAGQNEQPAQPAAPAPAPVVQEKIVQQPKAAPLPTPTPVQVQAPAATPTPQSDNTPSTSGGSCSGEAAGGNAFTAGSCSGGKTIVDQFNAMRAQWMPSLASSPYTWSDTLAKNSHDTAWAPDAMNKAEVMGHKLYSGSMGQCIAGSFGGTNTFFDAAKMWMCEIKQGPFCDKQTFGIGNDPTGHADIIKSTTYTKVGCYFMYKDNDQSTGSAMYVCDFA